MHIFFFRQEGKTREDLISRLESLDAKELSCDNQSQKEEIAASKDEIQKKFKESEKREEQFRRKLLSLQSESLPDGQDIANGI